MLEPPLALYQLRLVQFSGERISRIIAGKPGGNMMLNSRMRFAVILVVGVLGDASVGHAQNAAVKCNSKVPADIISGCTAIIDAGRETPHHLAMAYTYRGIAYAARGASDRAIADYTQAIRIFPSDSTAYFNRGVDYGSTKKFDLAIADFTKAIGLKPNYGRAYRDRGTVYELKGDKQRAAADYAKARSLGVN
jgi:tetratricopeptide (TPR) repeat protein